MNPNASLRIKIIGAFAAVYIIWGSTYLAIHYAIETIPPLLMAGSRFLTAGIILFIWARIKGAGLPNFADFKKATFIGALLLLGGNGMVVLAERSVPSGLTALLIATEPLMIVLLEWFRKGGIRPAGRASIGLLTGLAGVAFLIGPSNLSSVSNVDLFGAMLLMFASLSWAFGSLYASRAHSHASPLMNAAVQMVMGGAFLLIVGSAVGETHGFILSNITFSSIISEAYLIVFGSLVGYTCYSWMLRVVKPSLASTYAYVNPVVAVFLGWLIAGEQLSVKTIIAAAIILAGVILILSQKKKEPEPETMVAEPDVACELEPVTVKTRGNQ